MPEIEVAVWHPTLTAAVIEGRVGMQAKRAFTVGELRVPGEGRNFETYCRFRLGVLPRIKFKADLVLLQRFVELLYVDGFADTGGSVIVYFIQFGTERDVYIGREAVQCLGALNVGVVTYDDIE